MPAKAVSESLMARSRPSTIARDDLLSSSVVLQLAFAHSSTTDKKVGFLHLHVKSLTLIQLAAAAAGYTQDCWRPVSIPVLELLGEAYSTIWKCRVIDWHIGWRGWVRRRISRYGQVRAEKGASWDNGIMSGNRRAEGKRVCFDYYGGDGSVRTFETPHKIYNDAPCSSLAVHASTSHTLTYELKASLVQIQVRL